MRQNQRERAMPRARWSRAAAAVALAAMVLAVLAVPQAAIGADAAELVKEALGLRRQGKDAEALQKLQEAFETEKSPRVIAQIGLAEQALGRWVPAFEHLTEALEAKKDPWIAKNRTTIAQALATVAEHVGKVEILGGSAGAEVRIDGVARGTLPLKGPLILTTGTITIDLLAPGFVPVQRSAAVRPNQTSRESFDSLAPIPERRAQAQSGSTATPAGTAALTAGDPSGTGAGGPQTSKLPGLEPSGSSTDGGAGDGPSPIRGAAKWVAWGLGAGAAGLGLFGLIQQNRAADDFDGGCGVNPAGGIEPLPNSTVSPQGCRDLKADVDSNFRLEVIGFVGAAVFAGTGLALWLTEPKPGKSGSVAVTCLPDVTLDGRVTVGCRIRM